MPVAFNIKKKKKKKDEISNFITITETEIGQKIGELNQETKLKTPQQDKRMTEGNAAAAPREIDLLEVTNSDEKAPLQTEQITATMIDYNEEENNGQQNEDEEEEVDNEQHRLELEVELANKIEEIK